MRRLQAQSSPHRQARAELADRLRGRSEEIEEAMFVRIRDLSEPAEIEDQEYSEGLRATLKDGLDYALTALEHGPGWSEPIPAGAAAQARRSARSGVSLDTVLRRYAAADRAFGVFVVDEAEGLPRDIRQEIQKSHGVPVDRLMAAVALEYEEELARLDRSPTHRLRERVRRLLSGALEEVGDLNYDFEAWHVGLISFNPVSKDSFRALAARLDCQLLFVCGGEERAWAWLGRRRPLAVEEIEEALGDPAIEVGSSLGLGEPRYGLSGWRLTHGEAMAAVESLPHDPRPLTRCRDVVLLAAVMRDQTLTESLLFSYLKPLDVGGEEAGADLRKTLAEYLAAGHNTSTAAAALNVDRHTVQRRLRIIEQQLGQRIDECHAELQVALRVEQAFARQGQATLDSTPGTAA
jgi:hypothetical protein